MFNEKDSMYMGIALLYSRISKAERLKVGCCFVTQNNVVLGGVNGLPRPLGNVCEEEGVTKKETIHAELNGILKAAKEGISLVGSTLYVTHSPCKSCASILIEVGVKRVVYSEVFRETEGLLMLSLAGVVCEPLDTKQIEISE